MFEFGCGLHQGVLAHAGDAAQLRIGHARNSKPLRSGGARSGVCVSPFEVSEADTVPQVFEYPNFFYRIDESACMERGAKVESLRTMRHESPRASIDES